MVDEYSHLTDLTVKKVIQQFYWLVTLLVLIEGKVI